MVVVTGDVSLALLDVDKDEDRGRDDESEVVNNEMELEDDEIFVTRVVGVKLVLLAVDVPVIAILEEVPVLVVVAVVPVVVPVVVVLRLKVQAAPALPEELLLTPLLPFCVDDSPQSC